MRWLIGHQSNRRAGAHPRQPARDLVLVFLAIIFVGALLLRLPVSVRDGQLDWFTALFSSTSIVCVTGLLTFDPGAVFTPFGQGVVLLLIQAGGLGYMTASTLLFILFRRQPTLHDRLLLRATLGQVTLRDTRMVFFAALRFALLAELVGAVILSVRFLAMGEYGVGEAIWLGTFHAVSAFCNAGIVIFGGYGPHGLDAFQADWIVNFTIVALVIVGGLGFAVVRELVHYRRGARFSLHAQIVLMMSGWLIALGTLCVLAGEWTNPNTLGPLPAHEKLLGGFFHSVMTRTAGFATVDFAGMRSITLLLLGLFMFVGGSPGGVAGGVKTTTVAVVLVAMWTSLRGRQEAEVFGRHLNPEAIYRALLLIFLSVGVIVAGMFTLTFTEPDAMRAAGLEENLFMRLQFEAIAAFTTVGFSTGLTPALTTAGQITLMVLMFVGRLGPTAVATVLTTPAPASKRHLPEEKVALG